MADEITVSRPAEADLQKLAISEWPVWTCVVSEFPWSYIKREACYLLEGEVEVTTATGTVRFGAGDYVVFPAGLECTWKVLKAVRKHYRLG